MPAVAEKSQMLNINYAAYNGVCTLCLNSTCNFAVTYSEYSLIHCNSFSKNMVDSRDWRINWIFIGTCTLYWYWEMAVD